MKLTARYLENLKPPKTGRIELTDDDTRGLKFRLTNAGVATWSLQMNLNKKRRRFTIGEYPQIGLSEARKQAIKKRSQVNEGRDLIKEKRDAIDQAKLALTVAEALERYDQLHLKPNLETASERLKQLKAAFEDYLSSPIANITRVHLQKFIDDKSLTAPIAANRLRAALTAFIGWCFKRGYVSENFALATSKATKELPRERVLSIDEIRILWKTSDDLGPLWGPFLKLLILTSQRQGNVASMKWGQIDTDKKRWTLPAAQSKNKKPHIVHLSNASLLALKERAEFIEDGTDLIFTTTGTSPVSGFGKLKQRIDKMVPIEGWRFHDFRTAFATHLAEQGFDEGVVDRILNHSASATKASTVARVYNLADRLDDRSKALDKWALDVTDDN